MELSGQLHDLTALPPVSIEWVAGWAPKPELMQQNTEKFPAVNRTLAFQPVPRRYTVVWRLQKLSLCPIN
jgi:hypothetical protein